MDRSAQFSAKFEPGDAIGVPTSAPVRQVRDVLVCTNSSPEVPDGEWDRHPPIASSRWLDYGSTADPVELGYGLRIDHLSHEDAELVMNACTPRGHYFTPTRQFGHYFTPTRQFSQQYSFVRDVPLDEWAQQAFHWDPDSAIGDALMMSRLVRDNAVSRAFAARIAEFEDGEQTVVYTLGSEGKGVYRLRQGRDWLDANEGVALRNLLRAFRESEPFPSRVTRALFRVEYASWLRYADLELPILVSGLEALCKTDRHGATHQFKARVPAMAVELGFEGVTSAFASASMTRARTGSTARTFSSSAPAPSTRTPRQKAPKRAHLTPSSATHLPTSRAFKTSFEPQVGVASRTPSFASCSRTTRAFGLAGRRSRGAASDALLPGSPTRTLKAELLVTEGTFDPKTVFDLPDAELRQPSPTGPERRRVPGLGATGTTACKPRLAARPAR